MKMAKFHIKKGDTVKVLAGEYKGQTGKVIEMLGEKKQSIGRRYQRGEKTREAQRF